MTEMDNLIKKIKEQMELSEEGQGSVATQPSFEKTMDRNDYPLYEKHPDLVRAPSGKKLADITLDSVLANEVNTQDLRVTKETLKYQGEIAADAGRGAIQQNFARAAELTVIPDDRLLEMYGALRPYRSSKQELLDMAQELEDKYQATITANFFKEAANYYEVRKKLKGDN
ncbi:diol dehydratase small subunit [Vagococcus carniphilus]|uniref:Diol dehydratase small subunit n=1 Tax=Vagococcus carniphilus TaxID=218144 RepID=A0A430B1S2_9ENTE|nr:diol dehydratase small subunit [Vagococcus carniphilus]MDT2830810.1 diol dehydratase small subunit [Vagococcus carniphilus]MDT2834497.1 diol dehydratase small subunit [Vagococcus carniphilus]MDT2839418.1 diol dehydratase small subunit [Vagococcus carniphilus]MDT2848563.1 diol dehydratase small subunit [Vagococcus carniphilus]MDT2853973.1 diol dehydratase small subunit [Vagococcus carniphilus]